MVIAVMFAAVWSAACSGGATNENTTPVEVVNANPANNANIVPLTPTNGPVADTATNTGQANVTVLNPPTNPKPMVYSAPDDSEYSTSMDKSGSAIETRTFKNNKYIVKVTKVWKGVNDKTITIYLKSGKTVNLPGDRFADIKSIPVESFYAAAGIMNPQLPAPALPAKGKTKPGETDNPQ